jgi:hypothetical protein
MKALFCWVGLVTVLTVLACTSGGGVHCLVSNCDGCCDLNGMCQRGDQQFACGYGAAMCVSCRQNQMCSDGECVDFTGDGGLGGGSGNGGGSSGGSSSNGGGGGGSGACGSMTCAGCCDAMGTCRGGIANNACGKNGDTCVPCPMGKSCQMNACETFTCGGCVSTTNNCLLGTSAGACGIDGGSCQACLSGQSCVSGHCMTTSTCDSTTCAGCCQGATCYDPPTTANCGKGGGQCQPCSGTDVCNAGVCGPNSGTGGGSGTGCGPTTCASGCCDVVFNSCTTGVDDLTCGTGGSTCLPCLFGFHCMSQMCQ